MERMFVKKRNGNLEKVQFDKITARIDKLINNDERKYIDAVIIAQKTITSIYSGITTEELDIESAKICINLCTVHHLYSLIAGKILISNLHKKTIDTFVEKQELIQEKLGFLNVKWLNWIKENREQLNSIINYSNDYVFDYFGFKTLERAYLIKINDEIIERPQDMLLRVASFINCGNLEQTKKTYDLISKTYYTHASPTLFNSGNVKAQLSSCFEKNTLVNTHRGSIPIIDVQIGDEVITHLGNIKKVLQIHKNQINNRKLYKVYINNTNPFIVTEDHNLFCYNIKTTYRGWKPIMDLSEYDYIMMPYYPNYTPLDYETIKFKNFEYIQKQKYIPINNDNADPFIDVFNMINQNPKNGIIKLSNSNFEYTQFIKSQEVTIDDEYVYTLGVEDDHSYSIEGIIAQNCFLAGTDDSLEGITKTWADVSKISKWGGGIGLHVSNIRAKNTMIKGTNGPSSGIIPMLKVYNEIARYIDQCFVGSTKIYTESGLMPISKIKPGDKVFTHDGSLQMVKRIYNDYYEGEVINVKMDETIVKLTPNHPFYKPTTINIFDDENWNKLDDNDTVTFPKNYQSYDNEYYDETDCYMYGLIMKFCYFQDNAIFINTQNEKTIEFLNNYLKLNQIDYKQINNIHNIHNYTFTFKFSSNFKFTRSQIETFDTNLLNLPICKLKWILKGILNITKIIDGYLYFNYVPFQYIDHVKFMLLKLNVYFSSNCKILLTKEIKDLFEINNDEECIIEQNNDFIFNPVKIISKNNISEYVYDLEIENNHNYLTEIGIVHNGGKRKGSIAMYLEPWHPDIMAFLDLRKNNGAETERTRDLFTALWIPDLFMKQLEYDGNWYLMCPNKCPGLNDLYGEEFETLYWSYVEQKKYNSVIKAKKIMDAILDSQLETGTPYIAFKDHINKKSNQKNIGIIKSSNLCCEVVQYSDANEYAVCNLASIAINKFVIPFEQKNKFKVYTKENCKYCKWAKLYLTNNNYEFIEEAVDSETLKQLTNISENLTYPQIFYGEELIGGFTELFKFIKSTFDYEKLYDVAYTSTINLNNVIDINYYPVPETKLSNINHRPIGLGIQGLADALVLLKINFESDECFEFNSKLMETIYLAACTASADMAKERNFGMNDLILYFRNYEYPEYYDPNKIFDIEYVNNLYHTLKPNKCELTKPYSDKSGAYSTFEGSPISQGKFQFDLWDYDRNKLLYKNRWITLEKQIKKYGIRNSMLLALMPTASTSQILGNNECFEPFTNNIYTRRTLAGDFPLVNKYLIDDLLSLNLWNDEIKQLILANNGSILNFKIIPEVIRNLYKTVWEIKQSWVLKNALARGPFVDQTQSMNIFFAVPDYQKLFSSHMWAWKNGLKTGIYYLRSKPSINAAKVTVDPYIQKQLEEICESCSA
jgi:ribonucleotide reductase alpha subunit/intein/homing endonuclease